VPPRLGGHHCRFWNPHLDLQPSARTPSDSEHLDADLVGICPGQPFTGRRLVILGSACPAASSATCQQAGLESTCAEVTFSVVDKNGQVLLPVSQGYAVQVNGTWLVAKTTWCPLLNALYQTQKGGALPGC